MAISRSSTLEIKKVRNIRPSKCTANDAGARCAHPRTAASDWRIETLPQYRIAVIEGDGIGREVVPEGLRVLEAVGRCFDIDFSWRHFGWNCESYFKTGRMMP